MTEQEQPTSTFDIPAASEFHVERKVKYNHPESGRDIVHLGYNPQDREIHYATIFTAGYYLLLCLFEELNHEELQELVSDEPNFPREMFESLWEQARESQT